MASLESAVDGSEPLSGNVEISARTSVVVVALCWIGIFTEGYDVGFLGAILPALATDTSWKLTPIELGALGSYALFGMLVGGIIPVAAALTIEYSPARKKSLNYGIMYSGYSVGILAAALVGRALLPDHGWRPVVLIGAAPVVLVPLLAWLLPESLESLTARGRVDAARKLAAQLALPVPAGAPKSEAVGWRAVLGEIFSPRNAFATACFWSALFMGLLLVYGIAQWLPQIMRKSGYNLGDSLLFLAVFSFTSAIGGIVLGQWADRFGVKRTVALAYALGAIGIAALAFKGSMWLNYAFVAIAGFGTVSASLILTGYLADYLAPFVRSAGTGWALSFARIGALIGPLLGGYIASLNVGVQWNFYAFAVVAAIAAVATALIPKKFAVLERQ